ncbi:unnamed protein product [Lymnaea stagnalis]|uniref:Uncharacterized protein n=1 Tax=Lymnaea stagnalis TaxID=6523 RepID=A0AAV2HXM8_LYMST
MSHLQFIILTLVAFVSTKVSGQYGRSRDGIPLTWSVYDYPDPHSPNADDQRRCGRYNISSICDPNGVISRTAADAIENLINAVYRETTCGCFDCHKNKHGYIIRVALMHKFERIFKDEPNTSYANLRDAQMYSYILTQRWKMEGACNETLLILFSRADSLLYTLTRQGTKMKLKNDDVQRISLAVRHYFDKQDTIADGLMEMIRRYRLIFDNKYPEAFQPVSGKRV